VELALPLQLGQPAIVLLLQVAVDAAEQLLGLAQPAAALGLDLGVAQLAAVVPLPPGPVVHAGRDPARSASDRPTWTLDRAGSRAAGSSIIVAPSPWPQAGTTAWAKHDRVSKSTLIAIRIHESHLMSRRSGSLLTSSRQPRVLGLQLGGGAVGGA